MGVTEPPIEMGSAKAEMGEIVLLVRAVSPASVHGLAENLEVIHLFTHSRSGYLLRRDDVNSAGRGPGQRRASKMQLPWELSEQHGRRWAAFSERQSERSESRTFAFSFKTCSLYFAGNSASLAYTRLFRRIRPSLTDKPFCSKIQQTLGKILFHTTFGICHLPFICDGLKQKKKKHQLIKRY